MHSDWFNGTQILQGRWQHGEKLGYCYPSEFEKTLCKWDKYVPLVTKGLNYTQLINRGCELNINCYGLQMQLRHLAIVAVCSIFNHQHITDQAVKYVLNFKKELKLFEGKFLSDLEETRALNSARHQTYKYSPKSNELNTVMKYPIQIPAKDILS
jgi:hypothetical protein